MNTETQIKKASVVDIIQTTKYARKNYPGRRLPVDGIQIDATGVELVHGRFVLKSGKITGNATFEMGDE